MAIDTVGGRLRKQPGVLLYHVVQHLIRHRIHSGVYPPGSQIPTEHDLCRELAVSRITLREALREVVRENLLVKVQGKGTFVASHPQQQLAPVRYSGFLDELQERVRKLRVTSVEIMQTPVTADVQAALALGETEKELTLIKRLRNIGDEPFSYTLNYVPSDIGGRINRKDLYATPLLKILQEDLKIPILRARESIEAAPADPETARRLAVPVLYPVMHIRRVMYTTGNRPLELVDNYYRADKYHYSLNMVRVKQSGRWTWHTEVETSA